MDPEARPLDMGTHPVAGYDPPASNPAELRARLLEALSVLLRRLIGETELSVSASGTTTRHRIRLVDAPGGARTQLEALPDGDEGPAPRYRLWFDPEHDPLTEPVDLGLEVRTSGAGPRLRWRYAPSRFSPRRVAIISEQFQHLLAQIHRDPRLGPDRHSLVPPSHVRLLPDLGAALSKPPCPSIPSACLAWAQRTPDAPALVQGDRTWTYAELGARAREIAGALRGRSREAGDAVALSGPPSPGLIAAFLGILASGRLMVPLDPRLPASRRALMLREAKVADIVAVGPLALGERAERPTLTVDAVTGRIDPAWPAAELPDDLERDGPAYVIYTSGTTGTPKGILGTRQGVAHYVRWQREAFDLGPGHRFAHLTGISFDAVFRDVFVPLTGGATLVIPTDEQLASPLDFLRSARVTVLNTVPSRVEHWLRHARLGPRLTQLRYCFFGGEPLTAAFVRRWRLVAPDSRILNLYGPTETTVVKCQYEVPEPPRPGIQPIGTPLPNTQALVLDPEHRPCGIGEIGEISLRTPFRTLGYVDAPREYEARFIVNPRREDPEDILYRTGDRGRLRADGDIEILGRVDHQVKVRGMRIELGDVEAALRRHPEVDQAVVIATEGSTLDRMLVAFVVLARAQLPVDTLRSFVARELPSWMLPSAYVTVERLPLTINGKVDRGALRDRHARATANAAGSEAPPSATEALVIGHVRELLGHHRVDAADDFFALGGDSRAATHLVSRLRRDTGLALSLRVPFETPTIREIARSLDVLAAGPRANDCTLRDRLRGPSTLPPTETESIIL